ncbi:oligosaccharide flippase family protein [Epilithonimonas vandammei]|uniref:oligosaccharide flippase family protein n=1 Tax=Epilithonimonas vandammei TaxID=2487072 RepID=UPI0028A7C686|nr:oligosaccharide flippase family protein [Epilithonimonas vandammei]
MIKKIDFSEYKTVINNFFNLAFVQAINLILPLITIPYIMRVVGIEKFGLISFATSIVNYFGVLVAYGFNLTATKTIAQNINNKILINDLFCNVIYARIFLSIISLILFIIIQFLVKDFNNNFFIYLSLLLSVIFTNLSPDWFFQGVQNLKFLTRVNLVLKIISTSLTFLLISNKSDYYYLAVLPFLNSILLFLITQIYVQKKYNISFKRINLRSIYLELLNGRYLFLSQIKITFFSNFNVVVLGFLTNNTVVGIFSSADKIIKVFSSVQIPIVTALFPHFAYKIKQDKQKAYKELNKIAIYGSFIYIPILIVLFVLAKQVALLMFGTEINEISFLIRIMSIIPLLVFLNNLFGTQFLLNTGNEKKFLINLILAAVLNIILIFPLTIYFEGVGTAISVLVTEFFVLISLFYSANMVIKKSIEY